MIRGVIFDLDGTLIDSWPLHWHCLRHAAEATGVRRPSAATLATVQRATDVETLRVLVGGDRLDAARDAYRHALRAALAREPLPALPGAGATLDLLHGDGLVVGVCTGRSRGDAQALIDASGLPLDLTVAREDAEHPKPAPDGLLLALRLLGLSTDETWYVGDSSADTAQGFAAGVRTVLILPPGADRRTRGSDGATTMNRLLDLPAVLRKDR